MKPLSLLALPLALLSMSCGDKQPVISAPAPSRFEPVAEPAVPAGDTDADVSGYIGALVDALRAANAKLLWLGDWQRAVTNPSTDKTP